MRAQALFAVALLLSVLAVSGTAAARFGYPDPLTDRGRVVEEIYTQVTIAGLLVFILVFVLLLWVLVRYREGSGHGRATHEKHRGSLAAEMTWTLVPLAVVLWVGYIAYAGLVTLDRGEEDTEPEMTVHVTGFQWAWQMDYGEGVRILVNPSVDAATGNVSFSETFHLPADVPIELNLTGGDVIHAFNVMDANHAYFLMQDANPDGPHKYWTQVVSFPEGRYLIQCKEMCMNPGHAYMRAEILVEPRADFDRWLEEEQLGAGAELLQRFDAVADGDSLTVGGADNVTIVTGTRVLMDVDNQGTEDLHVMLPNDENVTVPAGQSGLMAFDTAVAGDFVVEASNAGLLTFRSVEAEIEEIDLGDFRLLPDRLELAAGKTYLFTVQNVHDTAHNVYIGDLQESTLANSATIAGGATTSFVWVAEAGEWDMWCDVPGHADLGMVGEISVR